MHQDPGVRLGERRRFTNPAWRDITKSIRDPRKPPSLIDVIRRPRVKPKQPATKAEEEKVVTAAQSIQVNIGKDLGTAIIGGITVEVSLESDVTVYTNNGVQTRPKAPVTALAKDGVDDTQVSIGKGFNAVALN